MPSLELRPEPSSPGEARGFVRMLMAEWGVEPEVADDAELLVTELVTNAIIHARTALRVQVEMGDGALEFVVADGSSRSVEIQSPSPEAVTGRGIFLLDQIASDWGVHPDGSGKEIRFRLVTSSLPVSR